MAKHFLQGKKDAMKQNLVAEYAFATEYGHDVMETTHIDGSKTCAVSQKLEDGRVLVEVSSI